MKGILKNTTAGWFVWHNVMRDEITSGYDSLPVHPEDIAYLSLVHDHYYDDVNLFPSAWEGKAVEFELIMGKPEHRYSETLYAKLVPTAEQTNGERLDEFTEKTIGLCDAKPPYVSDDFQIGPDGAYELGCSYPDCICQGNEITECKNRVYPELEGTMNLCNDMNEKKTGKMTEEEWLVAENTQTSKTNKNSTMIKAIKKDTYTLLLSDCLCEVFTYYGVKEMHGLNAKDCAAHVNNADQAYIAGWSNFAPKEDGEYHDYDARFIFINLSRCTDAISTMGLLMHETMHHSFWLHNYNVHKEEEIITWAEAEAHQIAKLIEKAA